MRRAFLVAALLCAAPGARAQGWVPFAGAAAFGTSEVTNTRQEAVVDGQVVSDRQVEVLEGYTLGARAGIVYLGARSRSAGVYSIGFSTSGELTLSPENLVQSVRVSDERTLSARWRLEADNDLFWGVTRVDQDLGAFGLSALPGGAGGAPPSTSEPGGALDPAAGTAAADRFAIHRIRFVRDDLRADVIYAPTPRWSHGFGVSLRFQTFLDDDIIRAFNLRLFDRYTGEGRYTLGWYPGPWDAFELRIAAGSTWFGVTDAGSDPDAAAATTYDATRSGRGEVVWRHILAPAWWSVLGGGGAVTLRARTDEAVYSATGRGGVRYESGNGRASLEASRGVESSEQGAVLEVTGLSLSAGRRLGQRVLVDASVSGTRQDPRIIVLRAGEDAAAERDRLAAWSAAAEARLAFVVGPHVLLVAGYSYAQRFPDAVDQTSLTHRVLAGVIVGTGESGAGQSGTSDFESFVP